MLKPHHVLLYLLCGFFPLWLLLFIFPEGGIAVWGNDFRLKYPTAKEFFTGEKPAYADISELVASVEVSDEVAPEAIIPANADTLVEQPGPENKPVHTIVEKFDVQELKTRGLEFPEGKENLLHNLFYAMRYARQQGKTVHILHYGDSQLEGDRITDYVRNKLQLQFGGGGVGLLPVMPLYNMSTVKHEAAGKWYRYPLFGKKDSRVPHNRYGIMHAISRFSPVRADTLPVDSVVYNAEVSIQKPKHGLKTARKANLLKLFYGYNRVPAAVEMYEDGVLMKQDSLPAGLSARTFSYKFSENTVSLTMKFSGYESPDFYGMVYSHDSGGVALDNIAMRGSSGTLFTQTDPPLLAQFYKQMNVGLFILQFGGNVMPYIEDSARVEQYARNIRRQIRFLHRLCPEVPVVFIGPSDMSFKEGEYYVTYPMLEYVNDALRQAAFGEGAAYWDMYRAMGGYNSMPKWVESNLAGKDYIHFSPKGARVIAEMFYEALIHEYRIYANEMAALPE